MRAPIKWANWLYCIAAWGLLAANVAAAAWAMLAPQSYLRHQLAISAALEVIVLGLPAAILLSTPKGAVFLTRFSVKSVGYGLIAVAPMALGGFFFFTGLNALITTLVASTGANVENAAAQTILGADSFWMLFLSISLIPGIVEEFLMRGVLLPAYARQGKWFAILLSGFLFAFLHGQPIAFLAQLALGILLGYLCWEARSIYPSMLYHAMHNGITVVLLRIVELVESDPLLSSEMSAAAVAAGEDLMQMIPSYVLMTLLGGAMFIVCLVFYRLMCRADREAQVKRGLYPDTLAQMPDGILEAETPRYVWLPMWLGLLGALLINALGFVAQFLA